MGRSVCIEYIESIFSYRGGVAVGGGAAAAVLPSVASLDPCSVHGEDGGCGVQCSLARIAFSGSVDVELHEAPGVQCIIARIIFSGSVNVEPHAGINLVYVGFGCRHRLLHVLVREEERAPKDSGGLSRSALISPLLVAICPDLFPVVGT